VLRVRGAASPTTVAVGVLSAAAYLLVLLALRHASAPSVAAVRETSVVIATALAAVFLHERVTPVRLAGAIAVVAGVAVLAAARGTEVSAPHASVVQPRVTSTQSLSYTGTPLLLNTHLIGIATGGGGGAFGLAKNV
jgi:drug/metabolite transporter (DMT)-like permease